MYLAIKIKYYQSKWINLLYYESHYQITRVSINQYLIDTAAPLLPAINIYGFNALTSPSACSRDFNLITVNISFFFFFFLLVTLRNSLIAVNKHDQKLFFRAGAKLARSLAKHARSTREKKNNYTMHRLPFFFFFSDYHL